VAALEVEKVLLVRAVVVALALVVITLWVRLELLIQVLAVEVVEHLVAEAARTMLEVLVVLVL
jgi:hypothetical protein